MPFLDKTDLQSAIYGYQIDQITDGDDDIVYQAINAAITEVKSYLEASTYDAATIFNAEGDDRNALILTHTATIAKWYIIELCNAEIIQAQAKDRYDRAVAWLKQLSRGTLNISELPTISITATTSESDTFGFGSRTKFNHE
jgi:phage gp36-like protein